MTGEFDARAEAQVDLVVAFHNSARREIIMRIRQRDSALFLYLAVAGTIFGFAFNGGQSGSLAFGSLFFVPLMGLGASYVYTQHNDVIGAIGEYLRSELDSFAERRLGHLSVPPQWDSSQSLANLRSHRRSSQASSLALLLLPQVAAVTVAVYQLPSSRAVTAGALLGVIAALLSAQVLIRSHRFRGRKLAGLRDLVRSRADADTSIESSSENALPGPDQLAAPGAGEEDRP